MGHKTVKPPNRPARLAIPDPLLWRRVKDLADYGPCIRFARHGIFLATLQSPLIFVIDGQVERVLGQGSFGSRDPGLYGPGHNDDDSDVERGEFDTQCIAVGVERRLAGIVCT